MDFTYSSEQSQLADSLKGMLADQHGFLQRQQMQRNPRNTRPAFWKHLADMGLTALMVPEADGGLGGRAEDLFAVMRELGRALVVEPYVATCVIAPAALCLAAAPAQRSALLAGIAAGDVRVAVALEAPQIQRAHDGAAGCVAQKAGDAWTLSGRHAGIAHLPDCGWLVIAARGGEQGLFLVDLSAAGVSTHSYSLVDGSSAGDITLDRVAAQRLGEAGASLPQSLRALSRLGAAAACAEALGVMELAYALARDYVHARQQFGKPLSGNQAVRHCIADMRVALESATSAAMLAAMAVDDPGAFEDPDGDIASAKLLLGRLGRKLCEDAIQMHGGVGMTEEFAVGHCLRRLLVLDHSFGNADVHLRRLALSLSPAGASAFSSISPVSPVSPVSP